MQLLLRRTSALLITLVVAAALWRFPFAQIALSTSLIVYAIFLRRYPHAWLIVIPAVIPVVDLTPWSGRFFFDEIDFVVLVTLAVELWRHDVRLPESQSPPRVLSVIIVFLMVSYALSLVVGLLPLQPLDANAFGHLYSHYNSLRIGKGFFEALALYFVLCRVVEPKQMLNRFCCGMILGLAGAVLAVLWERWVFSGLFDFSSDFRVTATFSGLHNGGADPEAYFVLAQPFILAWAWRYRSRGVYLAALALFAASTYGLLVTFSRAGYLAMAFSWMILLFFILARRETVSLRSVLKATAVAALAAVVVVPILSGDYVRHRFATVIEDWQYRVVQSLNSIKAMDEGWLTQWFGMGLGKYPRVFYARRPLPISPAVYEFMTESVNVFLRLFPGNPLYFEQYVNLRDHQKYTLSAKLRGTANATLSLHLCEKNLLYSFECVPTVQLKPVSADTWSQHSVNIHADFIGYSDSFVSWIWTRPVKLSLAGSGQDPVDVDDVKLVDPTAKNVVDNGTFSAGMDRWFFSTDEHLAWQVKNHWVHVFFEQGWLGVLSQLMFFGYVIHSLIRLALKGDPPPGVLLASVGGFLSVGLFGFLFDTPRIALLFYLVSFVGLVYAQENDPLARDTVGC